MEILLLAVGFALLGAGYLVWELYRSVQRNLTLQGEVQRVRDENRGLRSENRALSRVRAAPVMPDNASELGRRKSDRPAPLGEELQWDHLYDAKGRKTS